MERTTPSNRSSLDRRSFLGATVTATAGAALWGTAVTGQGETPDAARLPIGFLGVAYSHAAEKIRLMRNSPDFELVGVWAETDALARTYREQDVPVVDRDELLRRCVVIAVESEVQTHAEHARLALEAGCHVHLEKPPAETLEDFDALIRLAREKDRRLQVGYMWRYNPALRAAFEAVREGWLGDVFLVRAALNNSLDARRRAEWAAFRGGVLFELGSHLVDAIVRLLGRPERVASFLNTHGGDGDTLADNNVTIFEYPRATAILTSAALQPNAGAHRALEILGTRGTAVIRPLEPPTLHLDLARAAGPYRAGPQAVPLPAYRRYVDEFPALARAIRRGEPLEVPLDRERDVQETLLRACGVL